MSSTAGPHSLIFAAALLTATVPGITSTAPAVSDARLPVVLATAPSPTAAQILDDALEAMGGRGTLEAVRFVRVEGMEQGNLLEQSERPEGPWIRRHRRFSGVVDLDGMRSRFSSRSFGFLAGGGDRTVETVVADGVVARQVGERQSPGFAFEAESAAEAIALGPERVLLTAAGASDLALQPDTVLQDVPHHVLSFGWRGRPVRLYLNAHTRLPTAVEWVRAMPHGNWRVWGDVTIRVLFSLWELHPGGIWAPAQRTELRNGLPHSDTTLWSWRPVARPEDGTFSIPEETAAAYRAGADDTGVELGMTWQGTPGDRPELAPGVVQIQGRWHVAMARQEDGVVVLEAPISAAYSGQVIEEARRRFPELELKAVVTTSDAWPHVGGVREYVARGVPVHALDLNLPLLRRLVESPHRLRPDLLARSPRPPEFRVVAQRTTLGRGPNRIELIPVRGEGGERMMLAWFPAHRLLYAADLIQPGRDGGFFMPAYLAEVRAAVRREGLEPETVFAMHLGPTPWARVEAALAEIRGAAVVPE